jgi:hypothetical protein
MMRSRKIPNDSKSNAYAYIAIPILITIERI